MEKFEMWKFTLLEISQFWILIVQHYTCKANLEICFLTLAFQWKCIKVCFIMRKYQESSLDYFWIMCGVKYLLIGRPSLSRPIFVLVPWKRRSETFDQDWAKCDWALCPWDWWGKICRHKLPIRGKDRAEDQNQGLQFACTVRFIAPNS